MMVNWDDMSDEMLRDLVMALPRMMRPWERVRGSRELALWQAFEVSAPSREDDRGGACIEVALSFSDERDMVVWRWAAYDAGKLLQRGESFNRQRAMAEAEDVVRTLGFRLLPADIARPVMSLVKGER